MHGAWSTFVHELNVSLLWCATRVFAAAEATVSLFLPTRSSHNGHLVCDILASESIAQNLEPSFSQIHRFVRLRWSITASRTSQFYEALISTLAHNFTQNESRGG